MIRTLTRNKATGKLAAQLVRFKSNAVQRATGSQAAATRSRSRGDNNDFLAPFFAGDAFLEPRRAFNLMDRMMENFMPRAIPRFDIDQMMKSTLGMSDIAIDVVEKPSEYILTAEVPGVTKENLQVDVDAESGMLTIAAEKRVGPAEATPSEPAAKEGAAAAADTSVAKSGASDLSASSAEDSERVHRAERAYGRISRSLRLPSDVDMEKINAKLDAGVLTLTLTKKAGTDASGRKRIDIAGQQ